MAGILAARFGDTPTGQPVAGHLGKTIVLPNRERLSGRLLTGVLQGEGQPAVLIEETATTIAKSLRANTGLCIPIITHLQYPRRVAAPSGLGLRGRSA
jgi:hypothetical protein